MLNDMRVSIEKMVQSANNSFDQHIVHPIGKFLDQHELIKTIDIASKHVFRGIQMLGFVTLLPYSSLTNCLIGLFWSISYRITIERKCDFHFAVVSCVGGYAIESSLPSIVAIIDGTALKSMTALGKVLAGTSPMTLYLLVVVWISYAAVQAAKAQQIKQQTQHHQPTTSCCGGR